MSYENSLQGKPLDESTKQILTKIAGTIRTLSMDAVQKADSGHPGLPLGCADIASYLWAICLRYDPKNPKWLNRDRFVLSAGHGCMLLYSILHLAGYNISLDEIKNFRQLHSKTPGHPESFITEGVETTTGPLGQGLGNAVGMALGLKILSSRYRCEEYTHFDAKVFCLVGDGCIMEGVTSEVSSLAGHLNLSNLVIIYDANNICLDGPLSECCSEDTKTRYLSYGFAVYEIDGHDFDQIHRVFIEARKQEKPVLIIARTTIGKGSPNKSGSFKAHGAPLGAEEIALTKKALGLSQEEFHVPQVVRDFFLEKQEELHKKYEEWLRRFENCSRSCPDKRKELDSMVQKIIPDTLIKKIIELEIKEPTSGRKASQDIINVIVEELAGFIGGSADLSSSDHTFLKKFGIISKGLYLNRNIKFGVREFGMATIATGLAQTYFIPFIGTFLTFSDYMRNAIRLAALMKEKVIYQFTHDSIFLGEDGPTHQPVEHFATLRAIPNLQVIRPAGAYEVKMAWLAALKYEGPTVIILSRQNIPAIPETYIPYEKGMAHGGYIIKKESKGPVAFTLIATGSELPLAINSAQQLEKIGKPTRVVSIPNTFLFDKTSKQWKESVLPKEGIRVSIEAGVDQPWYKYIGLDGIAICMESFGASAPASALAKEFGFTVEAIVERILAERS